MRLVTFISAGAFVLTSAFMLRKENRALQKPLYDTRWSLKTIHTGSGSEEVLTKAFIRFNHVKQSAGGNGGCNSFGGTVFTEGSKIRLSHIFSTKMYCEGIQPTEDTFFKLLEQATRYVIVDNRLVLYREDDPLLEFMAS